jgi:hypothetical protein
MQLPSFISEIPKHQLIGYSVLLVVLIFVIFFVYGNTSMSKSIDKKNKSSLTTSSSSVSSNLLSIIDEINQRQERNMNIKNLYTN